MTKSFNYKKFIIVIIIFAVIISSYLLFFKKLSAPPSSEGVMPAKVAEVISKEIFQWDDFPGRIEPINIAVIHPRVSATIDQIHFIDGQAVVKDQLLFTLDQKPFLLEVSKAENTLDSAIATFNFAQTEFNRSAQLILSKAISQKDYDTSKNAFINAEDVLKQAKSNLEEAKLNLEYTEIKAPISGKISRAEITIGNLVDSGAKSDALATIVTWNPIYISFDIDEQTFLKYQKANLKPQDIKVEVKSAKDDQSFFEAKFYSFDNSINIATSTIRARAIIDNENNILVPGSFAHVRLAGLGKEEGVLVSEIAIGTDLSKKFVLLVDQQNQLQYQEVILGPVINKLRLIKSGLKKGDRIVLNGLQFLRPGMKINPIPITMLKHTEY